MNVFALEKPNRQVNRDGAKPQTSQRRGVDAQHHAELKQKNK